MIDKPRTMGEWAGSVVLVVNSEIVSELSLFIIATIIIVI